MSSLLFGWKTKQSRAQAAAENNSAAPLEEQVIALKAKVKMYATELEQRKSDNDALTATINEMTQTSLDMQKNAYKRAEANLTNIAEHDRVQKTCAQSSTCVECQRLRLQLQEKDTACIELVRKEQERSEWEKALLAKSTALQDANDSKLYLIDKLRQRRKALEAELEKRDLQLQDRDLQIATLRAQLLTLEPHIQHLPGKGSAAARTQTRSGSPPPPPRPGSTLSVPKQAPSVQSTPAHMPPQAQLRGASSHPRSPLPPRAFTPAQAATPVPAPVRKPAPTPPEAAPEAAEDSDTSRDAPGHSSAAHADDALALSLEERVLSLYSHFDIEEYKVRPPAIVNRCQHEKGYVRQFLPYILEEVRCELSEGLARITDQAAKKRPVPVRSTVEYMEEEDGVAAETMWIILSTTAKDMPKAEHGFVKVVIAMRAPGSEQLVLGIASRYRDGDEDGEDISGGRDGGSRSIQLTVQVLGHHYALLSPAPELEWFELCALIPAIRRTEACEDNVFPPFMKQIARCAPQPWPAEPAADPERQQRLACLNAQQRSVVNRICTTTDNGIYSLIGPPGTGKTSTIVQLLAERVRCFPQQKILLTAPSNKAVNVVLEKFLRTFPDSPMVACLRPDPDASVEARMASASGFVDLVLKPFEAIKKGVVNKMLEAYAAAHSEAVARLRALQGRPGQRVSKGWRLALDKLIQDVEEVALSAPSGGATTTDVLKTVIRNGRYALEQYMLQKAHIVFATLVASGRSSLFKTVQHFDCVVVDEAAQALIPETFIPFRFDPSLCLLIGDPQQLPGLVHSGELRSLGYAESLMGVLTEGRQRPHLERLSTQYRMHPSICKWISDRFYDGELVADAGLVHRPSPLTGLPASMPLRVLPSALIDCDFKENKGKHGEISNAKEAGVVMEAVKQLLRHGVAAERIGVITFYAAQVQVLCELRGRLAKELPQVKDLAAKLTISTVDGFQGDERDFILISCVRTVPSVGFLSDHRRINVALSRAKHARWVFGRALSLRNSNSDFADYFTWIDRPLCNAVTPATWVVSSVAARGSQG